MWSQQGAIELCKQLSIVAPAHGAFIGLTGGCLYKSTYNKLDLRKDIDIIIYRNRQVERIDWRGLFDTFDNIGVILKHNYGFVKKAVYREYSERLQRYTEKPIDFLYPEYEGDCDAYTIQG